MTHDKLNDLTHIGQLVGVFRRDVTTNLSAEELKALAWFVQGREDRRHRPRRTIGYVDTKQTLDGET